MSKLKSFLKLLHPKFQKLILDYPVDLKPRYTSEKPHPKLQTLIASNRDNYSRRLNSINNNAAVFQELSPDKKNEIDPFWANGFLPGLDICGIHQMLTEFKPKRYIEVGSGNSTKVAAWTIRKENLNTKIISIDPAPRAEIDELADFIIRKPFEDISTIPQIEAGDILFIDNSHRILPNSDAMVFFMETFPNLPTGVILQIHDIYLPYDYPQFMCDRFYTEQYGLAMYLLANPNKFEILLPNYFLSQNKQLSALTNSVWDHPNTKGAEKHGGSFWLKIN